MFNLIEFKKACLNVIDILEVLSTQMPISNENKQNQKYDIIYEEMKTYEDSFANIADSPFVASAVYYDLFQLVPKTISKHNSLKRVLKHYREYIEGYNEETAVDQYQLLKHTILEDSLILEFYLLCECDVYDKLLESHTESSLISFGLAVGETDNDLNQFLKKFDNNKLDLVAQTIVQAFLHGFISQNRDIRDRTNIRFQYYLGQEVLASKVVHQFLKHGIHAKVIKIMPHETFTQMHYDHTDDLSLYLTDAYVALYLSTYSQLTEVYKEELSNVSGYVGLGSFGSVEEAPTSKKEVVKLSKSQKNTYKNFQLEKRLLDDKYIQPSDISFCKITFPNPTIKGNFNDIFEDFIVINTMASDCYEQYQQIIIDALDKGKFIHCVGYNGNQTDIVVQMNALEDPDHQTNFMNCGGDLNIPHGEVFTTPKLTGTKGLLHFKQIFLKGYHYSDLKLFFEDGMVTEYTCNNFDTIAKNKAYLEQSLFGGHTTIPMGEFAIGTNTMAYKTLKKHRIVEELPILLVEKMGPHFAIGDPCYAFGEEQTVYNLLDGKEIIAKENEKTSCRHHNIQDAYVGFHVDMTIPYEEIYDLRVVNGDQELSLIKNGLFALPELSILNEPLVENKYDFTPYVDDINIFLQSLYVQKNRLKRNDYFEQPLEKLKRDQREIYKLYLENYEKSLLNPDYSYSNYGYVGLILSAILYEMKQMILHLYRKNELEFNQYLSFLHQVIECIETNHVDQIEDYYKTLQLNLLEEFKYGEYASHFLNRSFELGKGDVKKLFVYGYYVTDDELKTFKTLNQQPIMLLEQTGKVIAHAFDKGFRVQGKNRGLRKLVRLEFHLGQEPLMTYVDSHLKMLGYNTKVTQVIPSPLNMKMTLEHHEDNVIYFNDDYMVKRKQVLKDELSDQSKILSDVCGFVRLLQFGENELVPTVTESKLRMTESGKLLLKDLISFERRLSQYYMPKAEMSYTGAAYPSASIGQNFGAILKEIIEINCIPPEPHEAIQDIMIETLDQGDYIEIKGKMPNQTMIRVKLQEYCAEHNQTLFKNTGADVNIPVGEVFTSPRLEGTSGRLHVSEAYRDAFRYENLILDFEDGMVKEYSCSNFESTEKNKSFIESTLLYPHKTLPMGEFAIGTNTYAYKVAKKYKIIHLLPGLIVEKMGPHFAIGDTCFAYGEDVKVCNHTTGKEMVAKDNEITKKRKSGESVYFNTHTDITIPYEELAYVDVVVGTKRVSIIREGKFVLKGTESLNAHLKTED